jgi:cystathionine beta-lyase
MTEFSTRCVHDGTISDKEQKGINSPIYTSTSYEFIDQTDTIYPRYLNTPNEKAVAIKIASLEETEDALVLSSGMAAISTTLFAFLSKGDHVVFQKGLYGGTMHFITSELHRFGIEHTIAESHHHLDIRKAIKDNTRIIYIESPSNPLLNITDISKVSDIARDREIISVIDNTFASPVNQTPLKQGIDVVIHSATKYMGGHSDICAGAIASSRNLIQRIRETALNFGGSLNAFTLYLLERSLKTIDVRVQRINENAMKIAEFLSSDDHIIRVNYPGLVTHPDHQLARSQMNGFGGMLSFEIRDMDSLVFQRNLKLIKPSMSLGGLESIVSSPAHTSHRHLGPEGRKRDGISEGLIRMSTGIEDARDLIKDLQQAFN